MSPGKELLLSCIVMMHISFMASLPVEPTKLPENLQMNLQAIMLPCQDLWRAENNYTQEMFPEKPPSGLNIPVEGITLGNNTKEIKTSICAISNYLSNHMEKIISDILGPGDTSKEILGHIQRFTHQFKAATGVNPAMKCDVISLDGLSHFEMKKLGCQILSSVRKWVEHFAQSSCVFN